MGHWDRNTAKLPIGLILLGLIILGALASSAGRLQAQTVVVIHHPGFPIPLPRPIPPRWPRPTPRPEPTPSYKVQELSIEAQIRAQVAKVQVSQTFKNTGSSQIEVSLLFPLPYDGAIDSLTLMVDGKEFPAKLLDKDKARQTYEEIVRSNKDPALLEWVGTGMFQTSIFPVPAGAERKVTLTYNQLLRQQDKVTDFLFPLSTAKYTDKPLEKLKLRIRIESERKLKNIYSPTHSVDVQRSGEKIATVKYEAKDTIPTNDFRLFFDDSDKDLAASVLSYKPDKEDEGYFLLMASPPIPREMDDQPRKTVLFVVDRSGSMSGPKMQQAKDAAKFVLQNLREDDLFNIIPYDGAVETFRPELQKLDAETRKQALDYVDGLYAGGSTNIDDALSTSLGMLKDSEMPNYILFLTDGQPTSGETNEMKIVENAKKQNKLDARVLSFGVGYDVNSRLLDRLSQVCFGQSTFVRPDEDLETHVAALYRQVSAPVMTDVKIEIDVEEGGANAINRVLPGRVHDLFAGQQLVQVGRYRKGGDAKVTIEGKLGDERKKFDFPAKLTDKSDDKTYSFVAKLWAMRRIGEIIDELDLKGKNDELLEELVRLSTTHGILTPYTSFLADENQTSQELAESRRGMGESLTRARGLTDRLNISGGVEGFSQRAAKSSFQQAQNAAPQAAPADVFDAEATAPPNRFSGGMGGGNIGRWGFGGRRAAPGRIAAPGEEAQADAAEPASGPAITVNSQVIRDSRSDRQMVAGNVRSLGNRTLYYRQNTWFADDASEIDPEEDKEKYETVERFSPRYFELIAANTAEENSLLAQQQEDERLMLKLRGKHYLFE
ncbi:MAG: VIT domain-containing protein [Pirellulaceae bacterium]